MVSALFVPLLLSVAGEEVRTETTDAFQAALVAAVHRFAADGELNHLRAILRKYPKLVNARQTFPRPTKPSRTDNFTALHHAAEQGREEVVSWLLANGADVNRDAYLGWTPLHLAARKGHLAVVKLLVNAGAKLDAQTVAIPATVGVPPGSDASARPRRFPAIPSRTPLQLAQEARHTEVVEYLKTVK